MSTRRATSATGSRRSTGSSCGWRSSPSSSARPSRDTTMQTNLRGRDLINLQEWTKEEIDTVLDVAFELKRQRALGQPHPYLRDKVLAMLFFYSSTRTRASFEAGMAQLGGDAPVIESRTPQIPPGAPPREVGETRGRYNDGIAIRHVDWGTGNSYIRDVAAASRVPVL